MSNLDGIAGTIATDQLDGGGQTNLMTKGQGLRWQLLRQDTLLPITIPSQNGIVQQVAPSDDQYVLTFTRPSPGDDYVLRWIVPLTGNTTSFVDRLFTTTESIPGVSEFIPTVDDIGALLRTRTKDKYGSEVGTFNADTRPTDEDVLILIQAAYDTVVALSDTDIPKACWHSARTCIAIKAAMLVELSYWPDQIPLNQSPYAALRVEFEGANGDGGELAALHACSVRESEEEISGELPPTNSPVYSFEPRGYDVGQGTIW